MPMTDVSPEEHLVELVVASHQEDLRWLRRVPDAIRVTIYHKGGMMPLSDQVAGRTGLRRVPLPNVGREAHSYLTHLVTRRSSLARVTVFCQGHPFDHAPDFHERLRALADRRETPELFLWYGFLDETDDPFGRRLFVPWSKNPDRRELQTGFLYESLFGEPSPALFHFRGGAQFAVTREAVLKRPPEFYRQALRLSSDVENAAHSLERFWDRLFGEPVINPSDLDPDGVRYWKRIRRLEAGKMT